MTLNADMSFWVNTLIFNKLDEICPSLSLNGEDRKVYDICKQDFANYIKYLDGNHLRMENSPLFNSEPMSPIDEMISIMINETGGLVQNLENTKEMAEFVDMWVRWWMRKWTQRTKIIFNSKDLPPESLKSMSFTPNMFTSEEHEDCMRALIDKLIQYGEICCTKIMADALFKKGLDAANIINRREWTLQDKLNLLSKLQREARQMSYTHGPLVFIRPDYNYYKLREWRDDGANRII